METTKTNEALLEGTKVAEKWLNDVNAAMLEIYNKQLNLSNGLYNNLLNSFLGSNKGWNDGKMFTDNLLNGDLTKWFSSPFNGNGTLFSNSLIAPYNKIYQQMEDINRNLLQAFNNGIKNNELDWSDISKEVKDTLDNQLEASKKIIVSMTDGFNKQLDTSFETNKKLVENLNEQFKSAISQSQVILTDIMKAYQTPAKNDDKKSKESVQSDTKKRSVVLADI